MRQVDTLLKGREKFRVKVKCQSQRLLSKSNNTKLIEYTLNKHPAKELREILKLK